VRLLGVRCTPAARCAIDLARALPSPDALSVLDAALFAGACDVGELRLELVAHAHLRGVRAVRELVELANPHAQCRQESQLRLILHRGGFVEFEPQVEVFDQDGRRRYVLDLADRDRRIGVEYDGISHLDRSRLRADRTRHNWLENQGWRMRYFTDHDLYHDTAVILDTVRLARRAASPR
jgi:very-short-patch-repair endonuclease